MAVIPTNIFFAIKLFPEDRNTILKLYRENENFQTICDDYQKCDRALKRWHQSSSERAPARREEYADLMRELELEIRQYLNEYT